MSDDYEVSPIVPIGDKRYLCVEYPGYVKRTNRAISTLGGEKSLAEALAQDTTVKLKYRVAEPFAHPIQGHIVPNSKLLVKVTRRVKKDKLTGEVIKEAEEKWSTEIEGLVTKTLRFRALADFQYLVPEDDKIRQLRQALVQGDVNHILNYKVATDDDNLEDIRNIPPPLFTPIEGPLNYGYQQSAPVLRVRVKQPDGSFQIKLLNRSRATGFEVTAVRFQEENIPSKSWHILPKLERPLDIQVYQILSQFFEERPVWTRIAIKNKLASNLHIAIKPALIRIAYTFLDGPWRDCWVAYGKDPRKEPDWYKYQVVGIRKFFSFTSKDQKGKKVRKGRTTIESESMRKPFKEQPQIVGPQELHIFDGRKTSLDSSLYQLIDVVDPEIEPMIHNPDYRKPIVTKYSGFYYQCALERIRKVMRAKYRSILEKGVPLSYPNAEEGLMEEIEKEKESKEDEVDEDEERDEEKDGEDTNMAEASDAVNKAFDAMGSTDKSKRLKDVVDEYMNELTKSSNNEEELEDDLDALEEYDEEEFNYSNRDEVENEEGNSQVEAEEVRREPVLKIEEDTAMDIDKK